MNVMAYNDNEFWPQEADGLGFTLELIDPSAPSAHPDSWVVGCAQGSPTQPYDSDCLSGISVSIDALDNVLSASADGGNSEYTYIWTVNGLEVGTGESITTVINGNYVVTATDSNGCSGSSNPFVFEWVGIQDIKPSKLDLYPNPTSDQVWIMASEIGTIRIFSLDGSLKTEIKKGYGPQEISVSNLSAGYYLVSLQAEEHMYSSSLIVK